MTMIRTGSLNGIITRAVSRAVERHLDRGDTRRVAALKGSLRRELLGRIRQAGRSVRGMSRSDFLQELDRSRHDVLLKRDGAREELQTLAEKVALYRRLAKESETAWARRAAEGAELREGELAGRLRAALSRARRGEIDAKELEVRMIALAQEALRKERQRLLDGRTSEHDRRIDQLERRIRKLLETAERSEAIIQHLRRLKNVDPGVASIYREVQGLEDGDPLAEVKEEMLKDIFEANLALQRPEDPA